MKHWELEHNGEHIRAEWNESAVFNLQTSLNGQWIGYHYFTARGIETEQEALECVLEMLQEEVTI